MNRRDFLKKTAVTGMAVAIVPSLLNGLTPAAADSDNGDGQTSFHFVVVSQTADKGDRVALEGDGRVTPSNVEGGGLFTQWKNTGSAPFPIVGAGTWKAKRLISFNLIGTYGTLAAGILEMWVDLIRDIPSKAVIPARMKMVCNLGAAKLINAGEDEGVTVEVPAASLEFEPFGFGVTVFGVDNVREG